MSEADFLNDYFIDEEYDDEFNINDEETRREMTKSYFYKELFLK